MPNLGEIGLGALIALFWSYSCLTLAGHLRISSGVRSGYTRKVFHVLIFASAVVVNALGGFVAVCVFGLMVTIVVGHAILLGPGNRLYEAIAREQDRPHRTYYIVIPYFATLIGGVASNVFFGPVAVVGYLVGGLGDAAGEPAGTRWGKHHYLIRGVGTAKVSKTFEGSLAVLATSVVALLISASISPDLQLNSRSVIVVPLIAFACTLVEALSPRGWDNVSMQIVPTVLAAIFLSK